MPKRRAILTIDVEPDGRTRHRAGRHDGRVSFRRRECRPGA